MFFENARHDEPQIQVKCLGKSIERQFEVVCGNVEQHGKAKI